MRIARGTRIAAALFAVLIVLPLVGTRHAPAPAQPSQQQATVYSSMPLQGASRPQSLAVVQGARLALEEAGGRAGGHPVRYISLDNSTARAGTWTPENTAASARRAAQAADLGEPLKYYPTQRRHYFRITPNDRVQAGALAVAMRDRGCRRVAILNDGEVFGGGMGVLVRRNARRLGLRVVHTSQIRVRARRHRGPARRG